MPRQQKILNGKMRCSTCNKLKKLSKFKKSKGTKSGYSNPCKECVRKYQIGLRGSMTKKERNKQYKKYYPQRQKHAKNNKVETKKKRRNAQLKYKYGITASDFDTMFLQQGNKCSICCKERDPTKRYFAIDHNHKTGHIRGILCNHCNSKLLRYLRDNKMKAIGLIKYLDKALNEDTKWKV